ncbi:HAD family hydrolase [Neolewinella aurantiaca]|uniref:HAD family hydrolase n=1 Tax=Neolewinella aurantiaca TaxID=2602767 RepID=A0A5C7FFZ2_9BACT|nr:HAD family hydrolase [Neolewinella aurantiaca]TXF88577.1 HAD family hydrolase [Neolewinella aurantiaca]
MIKLDNITHIAFDADDTLWGHEHVFVDAKARCLELLQPYIKPGMDLEQELYAFERKNLKIFGYGVKGFSLSMIETAIELSEGKVRGAEIQQIIDLGKEMLMHEIDLLPGIPEAIAAFQPHFKLMIITKGDLFAQENKIARSGLGPEFDIVEIVSEKDPDTYRNLLRRHGIAPESFLMLGNSLKSDVFPIVEIGGQAVHIPYKYTWHHEAAPDEDRPSYWAPDGGVKELTRFVLNNL